MDISRAALEARYRSFSDEDLLEALRTGPEAYSATAWEVIQSSVASRALVSTEPTTGTAPHTPEPESSANRTTSTYLLWNRLLQGSPWPGDKPLPLRGRDFVAVLSLLSGALAWIVLILFFVSSSPFQPVFPVRLGPFALASALALGFGIAATRTPSPQTWTFIMVYWCVVPFNSLAALPDLSRASLMRLSVTTVSALLWLLYFGRRRPTFGLSAWPAIM
jgi:hypothetical protein